MIADKDRYTEWLIKKSRTLALNYKTLKLNLIKLNAYFSKQTFIDTYTEIQVIFHTVSLILSKIVLNVKMQKNNKIFDL